MRIPLTPHGTREILLFGGLFLLLAAAAWWWHPLASIVPLLLFVFVLSFFRDPERTVPTDAGIAVSPADGVVTDIQEVDEPLVIGGRALRVGIFLSVFNVHVNRAPLAGRVTKVHYKPGQMLDARRPDCSELNESNTIGFAGEHGPFAIKQITGAIARRIVCPIKEGDVLVRGARAGMIKFGSRTELFVPVDAGYEPAVAVGDKVQGALTIVLRRAADS